MTRTRRTIALLSGVLAFYAATVAGQQDQPQPPQSSEPTAAQPSQPAAEAPPKIDKRHLWIARYEADTKAAAAVGAIQASTANALKYSNLFETVKTFDSDAAQPQGTWKLIGKETDFSGGSAAKRSLVGFGSGRAKVTMEYTLHDPDNKVVWTQKITTKANFWGAATLGAAQDQSKAMDEQGQMLTDALAKYFAQSQKATKSAD